jgi:hypothetical protein
MVRHRRTGIVAVDYDDPVTIGAPFYRAAYLICRDTGRDSP